MELWKRFEIPEFEKKLKKVIELTEKIENPPNDRLLLIHRQLEQELKSLLSDGKVQFYKRIKDIILKKYPLYQVQSSELICYSEGQWSDDGYPVMNYFWESFNPTGGIVTDSWVKPISPKIFMEKLMSGIGLMPALDHEP